MYNYSMYRYTPMFIYIYIYTCLSVVSWLTVADADGLNLLKVVETLFTNCVTVDA